MPTMLVTIGPPTPLDVGVSYALPATACVLMANNAITTSTDGTTFTAHTSGQLSAAAFVKTAAAGTIVTCKRQ